MMNINKTAKFLVYLSAAACAIGVFLSIISLVNGDVEGLAYNIFLSMVAAICLWVNLGTASGPEF